MEVVFGILAFMFVVFFVAMIPAFFFQWAWMAFAVPVFHAPPITVWQAWAALILIGFVQGLFKGVTK